MEEDLKDGNKLPTIEEINLRDGFGLEDAGEEADTHIVHAHLVELLPADDLLLEEEE